MKTIIIDVAKSGATIELSLVPGRTSGQVVLVLTEDVQLGPSSPIPSAHKNGSDFPPRRLTEHTIVQILSEFGGSTRIRDTETGWNIYDEIAARLGVSVEARKRVTAGTGEPAWRPEVGYCRKNLEQAGKLEGTDISGRGIWTLKKST